MPSIQQKMRQRILQVKWQVHLQSQRERKKFSEKTKKMKQSVEGAIMRYGVTYKGGLAKYPKQQSGEIG